MKHRGLLAIFGLWLALFIFVVAGYSSGLGPSTITGFAVRDSTGAVQNGTLGLQSIIIMLLFFTNIVTVFFLVRERFEK